MNEEKRYLPGVFGLLPIVRRFPAESREIPHTPLPFPISEACFIVIKKVSNTSGLDLFYSGKTCLKIRQQGPVNGIAEFCHTTSTSRPVGRPQHKG